jgi:hypothetical protein
MTLEALSYTRPPGSSFLNVWNASVAAPTTPALFPSLARSTCRDFVAAGRALLRTPWSIWSTSWGGTLYHPSPQNQTARIEGVDDDSVRKTIL